MKMFSMLLKSNKQQYLQHLFLSWDLKFIYKFMTVAISHYHLITQLPNKVLNRFFT